MFSIILFSGMYFDNSAAIDLVVLGPSEQLIRSLLQSVALVLMSTLFILVMSELTLGRAGYGLSKKYSIYDGFRVKNQEEAQGV